MSPCSEQVVKALDAAQKVAKAPVRDLFTDVYDEVRVAPRSHVI